VLNELEARGVLNDLFGTTAAWCVDAANHEEAKRDELQRGATKRSASGKHTYGCVGERASGRPSWHQ